MGIYLLENTIQKYDWGSSVAIASFLGRQNPEAEPWAELWMGAHPKAPSVAIDPETGVCVKLDELIASDPERILGSRTDALFNHKLPFLFKILSAAKPLSIQAHPTKLKAEHGFDKEDRAGIPLDAAERNYRDRNHKPETAVAMTHFEGLCGFRPIPEIIEDIRLLSPKDWRQYVGRLEASPGKLEMSVFYYTIVSMGAERKTNTLAFSKARCERIAGDPGIGMRRKQPFGWVLKLMDAYPGDIGALAPLVLNLFRLEPGQGLNLMAGVPHAYLSGTAFEIMANSDNVLRGGLTSKHIDIPELISVLAFNSETYTPIEPEPSGDGFLSYPSGFPDYALARADIRQQIVMRNRAGPAGGSPEILLCTDGALELYRGNGSALHLHRGDSVFITADEKSCTLAGDGQVFRASVPG
jgi:mannose-6-phosphate isomerase